LGTLKTKRVLSLAAFVAVLLVGWYLWGPAGAKLTSLNEANLAQFAQQFDGAEDGECPFLSRKFPVQGSGNPAIALVLDRRCSLVDG
jgi:hypothetical protein